jgi:galactokinase
VFNFNLHEQEKPASYRISLDELASHDSDSLRRLLATAQDERAACIVGCFFVLHDQRLIDLHDPRIKGFSLALYSTIPAGAGPLAALQVTTMMLLRHHFALVVESGTGGPSHESLTPMRLAELCQLVQDRIVGSPCGIVNHVTSVLGRQGQLLRMVCQPHELQEGLAIPPGMRCIGIDSGVKQEDGRIASARTRCASFMGHAIILEQMRRIGQAAGRQLVGDPLHGYLANLDPDDYKRIFRPRIPERLSGAEFLDQFGGTIDPLSRIGPDVIYEIQHATDHHVLEARRVRNFAKYLEQAAAAPGPRQKGGALDRAGHLMYASHLSYTMDAMIGSPQCDLLVQLARARERQGIYGARITGPGSGGMVAVLADTSPASDAAIEEVMREYETQTGRKPQAATGSSPGAWHVGTEVAEVR